MNFTQRYQPTRTWFNEFDRLFDRSAFNAPRETFHETENAWVLRIDLPGYAKEDIQLSLTDDILELTAETSPETAFGGKLVRRWKLGGDVDGANTNARLDNGVLELTLPKKPKAVPQPTNIEIQSSNN
ncbi:Hsp20/alpha crystallin family protein [Luteolibacter yonseiensis]|uniref:Hsp20/alpha crystallin family protein n=1 Tax=Luteolibacter yonseiensis TaxID=1144680 RepID=A0A934R9Y3_9BACT|nr:Hsp20/alpha crystallin family protein [Luteolibacter yonseiensis]MBK1817729.1 Hsp20/alpha crystallin family protein [Luteolibacter yonseiensis]